MIKAGMQGCAETVVTQEKTADAMGSGSLVVFATPCMAALMEQAAVNALAPGLDSGESSVGTSLHITHDAATPLGAKVWAQAKVTAVEGRRISLSVTAWDEAGPIGSGTHDRALITVDRFLAKAAARIPSP